MIEFEAVQQEFDKDSLVAWKQTYGLGFLGESLMRIANRRVPAGPGATRVKNLGNEAKTNPDFIGFFLS